MRAVTVTPIDGWSPDQYERFRSERQQPFDDLLTLCHPVPGGRIVDLGCGTGDLTKILHEEMAAEETVGIDSSPAMLERAQSSYGERRGPLLRAGRHRDVARRRASISCSPMRRCSGSTIT